MREAITGVIDAVLRQIPGTHLSIRSAIRRVALADVVVIQRTLVWQQHFVEFARAVVIELMVKPEIVNGGGVEEGRCSKGLPAGRTNRLAR